MQQRSRGWYPRLGLLASVALIISACGTAASPSPSASAPTEPTEAPASEAAASEAPFENAIVWPPEGEAPCGEEGYTGTIKKISAIEPAQGRVPAVRARPGVPAEGRVRRLRHPGRRLPRGPRGRQVDPRAAERHRPVQAQLVGEGQPDPPRGQPRLPRHRAAHAEPRVPLERPGRAAAPRARMPATSMASTTPAPMTSRRSRATATSRSSRARA